MPLSLETVEYSSSAVTLPDFPAICISALNEAIASLASAIALDAFEPNAVMTSPALFTLPLLSTILFLNFTTWSLNFEYESRPLAFELLFSSLSICRIVSINCTPDTLVCLRLSEAFLALDVISPMPLMLTVIGAPLDSPTLFTIWVSWVLKLLIAAWSTCKPTLTFGGFLSIREIIS